MPDPISKYEEGKLWRLQGGIYYEDRLGIFSMGHLARLKDLPSELRTQQDHKHIEELQAAFRARREAEGES